jgi:DNA-binding MarR family transcriptional regulator
MCYEIIMANSSSSDGTTPAAGLPEAGSAGPSNPLDSLLGYQLRRASAVMLADLAESLGDLGLRTTEASVILVIEANPGIIQSEVGKMLGIQRANMAPLAAHLTEQGWILRSRPDGRSQGLRLSEAGLDLAGKVRARISTHEARFACDLSPIEREELVKRLHRLWAGEPEG